MGMTIEGCLKQMIHDGKTYDECKENISTVWCPENRKEALVILDTLFDKGCFNDLDSTDKKTILVCEEFGVGGYGLQVEDLVKAMSDFGGDVEAASKASEALSVQLRDLKEPPKIMIQEAGYFGGRVEKRYSKNRDGGNNRKIKRRKKRKKPSKR